MYINALKGGPVLLSNSQAGQGRNFSQPRAHLLVHLCKPNKMVSLTSCLISRNISGFREHPFLCASYCIHKLQARGLLAIRMRIPSDAFEVEKEREESNAKGPQGALQRERKDEERATPKSRFQSRKKGPLHA